MTAQLVDPAWQQSERPDAGPDDGDVATERVCDGPCGETWPLDELDVTREGRLVCFSCYFDGFDKWARDEEPGI